MQSKWLKCHTQVFGEKVYNHKFVKAKDSLSSPATMVPHLDNLFT